jgi:acyl-CoA hydrolase
MTERPRPVRASRVEMTEIVLPEDTNPYGLLYGGRVMALIDKAAAIAALRHCRANVVTALVDTLQFLSPVKLGSILRLHAAVHAVFGTSLEVGVEVTSEDPYTGRIAHCCSAFVVMVSFDAGGRPLRMPRLRTRGAAERARERDAWRRRRARLRRRGSRVPRRASAD